MYFTGEELVIDARKHRPRQVKEPMLMGKLGSLSKVYP